MAGSRASPGARYYRKIFDERASVCEAGKKFGMLGAIFKKRGKFSKTRHAPPLDRHRERVKHAGRYQERRIYEGLLEKSL